MIRVATIHITLLIVWPLSARPSTVQVPAGRHVPFLNGQGAKPEAIASFQLMTKPVTNLEFYRFVKSKPEWSASRKPDIFADKGYLNHWQNGKPSKEMEQFPVVNVSYFAAAEYCKSIGMRLPETLQWEYAASFASADAPYENKKAIAKRILAWYSAGTRKKQDAGKGFKNILGITDLHGSVWEWTSDFNIATVASDSRNANDSDLYCGGAAANAADPSEYATFMRYAFRASLTAKSTNQNLGFRCAVKKP